MKKIDYLIVGSGLSGASIARLLSDAGLRSRLATAGFELYEQRYRWPDIRERFASVVAGLADR